MQDAARNQKWNAGTKQSDQPLEARIQARLTPVTRPSSGKGARWEEMSLVRVVPAINTSIAMGS